MSGNCLGCKHKCAAAKKQTTIMECIFIDIPIPAVVSFLVCFLLVILVMAVNLEHGKRIMAEQQLEHLKHTMQQMYAMDHPIPATPQSNN